MIDNKTWSVQEGEEKGDIHVYRTPEDCLHFLTRYCLCKPRFLHATGGDVEHCCRDRVVVIHKELQEDA